MRGPFDLGIERDAENRLTAVKQGGNKLASFTYDGEGRRSTKTTGGLTASYVYDGAQFLEDPIHLLRVWIRVRMENRSSERYILPRLVMPPRGGRVKGESEPQRSYEFWGSEIHGPNRTAKFGPQPDSERFVLLAPSEAFETMTTTGVQVDFSSGSIPKTVKPGDDVLLEVPIEIAPARPISDEAVRALTEGWRRVGKLITGTVWSGPLHVQVPARR